MIQKYLFIFSCIYQISSSAFSKVLLYEYQCQLYSIDGNIPSEWPNYIIGEDMSEIQIYNTYKPTWRDVMIGRTKKTLSIFKNDKEVEIAQSQKDKQYGELLGQSWSNYMEEHHTYFSQCMLGDSPCETAYNIIRSGSFDKESSFFRYEIINECKKK